MKIALLCFFAIIATVYSTPTLEKLPNLLDCVTPPPKCDHKTTPTTPKPTTKKHHDDCDTTVPVTPKPTTTDDCDTTPVTKHTTVTQTTDDDCTTTPKYTTPKYTTPKYTTPKYTTPKYTTPKYTTPKGHDDCDTPKPHGYKPPKQKSVDSVAGSVAGADGDSSFAESFAAAKATY